MNSTTRTSLTRDEMRQTILAMCDGLEAAGEDMVSLEVVRRLCGGQRIVEGGRQTGRTTRMLERVREALVAGRRCLVLCADGRHQQHLSMVFGAMTRGGTGYDNGGRVTFATGLRNVDANTGTRVFGMPEVPEGRTFADHYTVETHAGWLLREWLASLPPVHP